MLFDVSIRKELGRNFGVILVALVTIVMTMMLIRVLGLAIKGRINPTDVLLVMGYFVLGHLPTVLTLCLFVAIIATLTRMYNDSEMVIWLSSGQGLNVFLRPLFRFAWPVLLVITLSALFVWPWSNTQTQNLRQQYEQRGDLDRIAPGQFQESANGNRVFFIDKTNDDNNTRSNIFIAEKDERRESVTSAQKGYVQLKDLDQYLVLQSGQRTESVPNKKEIRVSDFEEYGTVIHRYKIFTPETMPAKTRSSWSLLQNFNPINKAELAWRVGIIFAAFNFVFMALAIANANPRVGQGISLIIALLCFAIYYNFINISQSWISRERIDFFIGLIGMHGFTFLITGFWLLMRKNNWSIYQFFMRKTIIQSRA